MKRRLTIEVDDEVFPVAASHATAKARMQAEVELGYMVGRVERPGLRGEAIEKLREYGVTLISDEQVD